MTNGITVSSEYRHRVLYPCSPHNRTLQRDEYMSQPPAFHNKSKSHSPRSTLTEMTWLSQKAAWFSCYQRARQPPRTCQCSDLRPSSTSQRQYRSSWGPCSSWVCPALRPYPQPAPCWQSPDTPRSFSPLLTPSVSKHSESNRRVVFVGQWFEETDSRPFSVTEINTLIIPSLLRRDRATGMPRSLTIERNVSALRLSHGNVF